MANLIENFSYAQLLMLNLLGVILGYSLKFTLTKVNQKWVNTYHQTLTYCLLPPITSVITSLISSNIALSLGMIGALSIVRFRTPVKSPLELVMFFALITIGIGIPVNYKLSVFLTLVIVLVFFILNTIQIYYKKKSKSFIYSSYDEGTPYNVLEVSSKEKLESIEKSKNLESFYFNKDENVYNYRLVYIYKLDLENEKNSLEKNNNINSINIKYVI